MKPNNFVFLVASFCLTFFFSCKKKTEEPQTVAVNTIPNTSSKNKKPVIDLGTGSNYTVYTKGDTSISLTATVSDTDGVVKRVRFYINNVSVGEDLIAPFSITHHFLLASGKNYSIQAAAFDNVGDSTMSAVSVLSFVTNRWPSVSVITKGNYIIHSSRDTTLTVEVAASDTDGVVSRVKFYINNALVGEDATAPFSISNNFSLNFGKNYSIKALAFDNKGDSTMSAVSMLTISTPPVATSASFTVDGGVAIPASVTASRTVGGNTFTVTLSGTDSDPTISLKIATNGAAGTFTGFTSQSATYGIIATPASHNSFYGTQANAITSTFNITTLTQNRIAGTFDFVAKTSDLTGTKTVTGSFDVAY
jgi:hypothetical protein